MGKSSRLKRLAATQLRLRTLEQLELAHRRHALVEAEAARQHVLDRVSGAGSTEQAWLVARTNASLRTARQVEAAVMGVVDQTARLSERASVCLLLSRLCSEAEQQDRTRREASELTEALERVTVFSEDSAGQD
jgi:hypothetical protein